MQVEFREVVGLGVGPARLAVARAQRQARWIRGVGGLSPNDPACLVASTSSVYGIGSPDWVYERTSLQQNLDLGECPTVILFKQFPTSLHCSRCHFDIPMRGCTLYLDDEVIVRDGDITVDDMKPAGRR
ncbi:leucyl aminopeptidase [Rhodococcus qingshengii BKS 20-40]|nr:leucyl aminopeptidase [Rhodococcus qingshengii BKS 20-40]